MKASVENNQSYLNLFFIVLYMCIPYVNLLDTIDELGPQWFFLSLLNFITSIFLLLRGAQRDTLVKNLFLNKLNLIYVAYLLWSGLSIFYSINVTETYLNLSRLAATFIAFFNIGILLYNQKMSLKYVSIILTIILLIQSVYDLKLFLNGMYVTNLDTLILSIKENMGNKNVLAANLVIKIPFCIYLIFTLKQFWKALVSIVLFFAITMIFILNARASIVELLVITAILLLYAIKHFITNKKERGELVTNIAAFFVPALIAIAVSTVLLNNAVNYNKTELKVNTGYGTIGKRVGLINQSAESNSRIALWKDALKYIQQNPILGCGIGNWKITSVIYSKERDNDFIVPYHSHNDFLETTAETGILGGLLYFSIFLVSGITLIKIFFKSKIEGAELFSVVALMGLTTYVLDAALNFPMERPPMQVLFALVFAVILNITNHDTHDNIEDKGDKKEKNNYLIKIFAIIFLMMSMPTMYYTYAHFQSLKMQKIVYFSDKKFNLTNEELDNMVTENKPVPNLNYSAIPIDVTLANIYTKNGNFEKASYLLERSKNDNPYLGIYEFNKGILFFRQNNIDSGNKYFKIAFDKRPRSIDTYRNLIVTYAQKRDTAGITSAFKTFTKFRNEPLAWQLYLSTMVQAAGRGSEALIRIADTAIKNFPDSIVPLTNLRNYVIQTMNNNVVVDNNTAQASNVITGPDANLIVIKINKLKQDGINMFNEKNYKNAIGIYRELTKLQPNDYSYVENIGICYYILNDFKNANIYFNKVIALGLAKDGKSEFYNAISLFQFGQKDAGCSMLNAAKSKNYDAKMIDQYKQIYCK